MTREGFAFDPARGELWFAGEAAEAVLLELEARRRALEAEIDELEAAAERATTQAPARDTRPAELGRGARGVAGRRRSKRRPVRAEPRGARGRARPAGARARRASFASWAPGKPSSGARLGRPASVRRRSTSSCATLAAEAKELERRMAEAGAEPAEGDDPEELADKLARLERRREALGSVNPLAKEEYEREKERLTELRRAARGPRGEPEGARRACATSSPRRSSAASRRPSPPSVSTSRRSPRRSSRAARAGCA